MSDALGAAAPDPDSEGCLCVVTSFVSVARTIDEITKETAKRTLMSPVLSDFIEFCFTDLGPKQPPDGDRSAVIRRITSPMVDSPGVAGRNHFALVVVDRSAAVVAQLLADCAASPFLGELRVRSLGIAITDDRPSGDRAARIETPPAGVWSREDLVGILREFADELLRDFSARNEPGLSVAELGDLRDRYHAHKDQHAPGADPTGSADTVRSAVATGAADADATSSGPPQVVKAQGSGAAPEPGPEPDLLAGALPPGSPGKDGDGQVTEPEAFGPPGESGLASWARRWVPDLLRRRGQPTGAVAADEAGDKAEDSEPETEGLAYLLVVGDESCRDEAALNRSRSALLEVDKKISELPGLAYRVRMLHGDENGLHGELREAGQVRRRDLRRTVAGADFAAVLESVLASLNRDRMSLKAAAGTAVVFFTPEPPLADTVAAELFRHVAQAAAITWALPKNAKALLSAAFTDVPGVRVVIDDLAVADEIAAALTSSAGAAQPNF